MGKDEAFLARWSRRKRNAAARADAENNLPERVADSAKPISRTADETTPTAPLPPIESIEAASDITAFLAPGVPLELTRAALRRVWTADPAIRNFIGLSENAWDFNTPGGVPGFGSLDLEEIGRLAARVLDEPRVTTPTSASALVVDEPAPPVEAPPAVPTIAPRKSIGASHHKNDQRKAGQGRPRHHHGGALPQ
jgi:hypothetical protein